MSLQQELGLALNHGHLAGIDFQKLKLVFIGSHNVLLVDIFLVEYLLFGLVFGPLEF